MEYYGEHWAFPIEHVRAEIVLPRGAHVEAFAAYVGRPLSKGQDFKASQGRGRLLVETTRVLSPGEGLTVAALWPKGFMAEPEGMRGVSFLLKQHSGLVPALLGLLTMVGYYRYAWNRVGRDPRSRGLAPFYVPPEGVSPAMAGYIKTMGAMNSKKALTTSIVSLASQGYLLIDEAGSGLFTITRTDKEVAGDEMSEDEALVLGALRGSFTLTPHDTTMISLSGQLMSVLKNLCRKRYFFVNTGRWLVGLVPLIFSVVLMAIFYDFGEYFWFGSLFFFIFGGVSLSLILFAVKLRSCLFIGMGLMFLPGAIPGLIFMGLSGSWLVILLLAIMFALFVLMAKPMRAMTEEGQRALEHINGLQLYLEKVEESILQKFDPPEMSRELYERYLPYAVALDVESQWGDKFALAIGGAMVVAEVKAVADTRPQWFSSSRSSSSLFSSRDGGRFSAGSMVHSFGSALSAASTSRSNSGSSSSGGGSSGGGGGGGW